MSGPSGFFCGRSSPWVSPGLMSRPRQDHGMSETWRDSHLRGFPIPGRLHRRVFLQEAEGRHQDEASRIRSHWDVRQQLVCCGSAASTPPITLLPLLSWQIPDHVGLLAGLSHRQAHVCRAGGTSGEPATGQRSAGLSGSDTSVWMCFSKNMFLKREFVTVTLFCMPVISW